MWKKFISDTIIECGDARSAKKSASTVTDCMYARVRSVGSMQRPVLQRVFCLLSAIYLLRLAAPVQARDESAMATAPTALKSPASEHGGRSTCDRASASLAGIFARKSMDEKLFIKARPDTRKTYIII